MWLVKNEVSMVDYYVYYTDRLRAKGFKILIVALIREADAPEYFGDLHRYWESLDDVTGPSVVFAVAAPDVADSFQLNTAIQVGGRGRSRSENPAREPFEAINFSFGSLTNIQTLGFQMTKGANQALLSRRVEADRAIDPGQHHPILPPSSKDLATANTLQISELAQSLGLTERDLPCLHISSLVGPEKSTAVVSLKDKGGFSIYSICKDIMETLGPFISEFPQKGGSPQIYALSAEEAATRNKIEEIAAIIREEEDFLSKIVRSRPPTVFDWKLSKTADEIRLEASNSLSDDDALRVDEILEMLLYSFRTKGRKRRIAAKLEILENRNIDHLLHKLKEVEDLVDGGANVVPNYELETYSEIRRKRIAELESEKHQYAVHLDRIVETIRREEVVIERDSRIKSREVASALAQAVVGLGCEMKSGRHDIAQTWELFLSYARPDRQLAIELFKKIEGFGRIFMDHFCLLPGEMWRQKLQEAQSRSKITIALLTTNIGNENEAWYQSSEIETAINLVRSGGHKIIPVYIGENPRLRFGLEQVHSIVADDIDGAARELLRVIEKAR